MKTWMSSVAMILALLSGVSCAKFASEEARTIADCLGDDACEERRLNAPINGSEIGDAPIFSDDSTSLGDKIEVRNYEHIDPTHLIPRRPFNQAIEYFDNHRSRFPNQRYITIIDLSQKSNKRRLYLVDMVSGAVTQHLTSHGRNSDANNDGYADAFSNVSGSKMSSLGFYRTAETYQGSHGYSLRLDGLSPSNSNARSRAIVVHGASYVSEENGRAGRSWGCPALDLDFHTQYINRVKGGSLMYVWFNQ